MQNGNQDSKKVLYSKQNGVAWIVLNNPTKYNALELELRKELRHFLEMAAADDEVRVVVIRGAGGNFSAGADIRAFLEWTPETTVKIANEVGTSMVLSEIIRNMVKPVVAVVEGYCLGGGFELAMACDFIIASENAVFGQPEINLGLIPGGGGTQRLARLIGEKKAKEVVMLGERYPAKVMAEMGVVNLVAPQNDLENVVKQFIERLLSKPAVALAMAKEAVNLALETHLSGGLRAELMLFSRLFATEDQKEGAKAFLEKRKPFWKGR